MVLQTHLWEKILRRWSRFEPSPERNLVIAIIAGALTDDITGDTETGWFTEREKREWFSSDAFLSYCRICGLEGDFVNEMYRLADEYKREEVCHA